MHGVYVGVACSGCGTLTAKTAHRAQEICVAGTKIEEQDRHLCRESRRLPNSCGGLIPHYYDPIARLVVTNAGLEIQNDPSRDLASTQ